MKPYRGLTKDGKMVYGWYCKVEGKHYIILDDALIDVDDYGLNSGIEGFVEVIPATVAQQVGLKDKNEKEIYPGDKLQSDKRILTVVWDEEDMQWKALEEEGRYCLSLSVWAISNEFEIIPPEVKEKPK